MVVPRKKKTWSSFSRNCAPPPFTPDIRLSNQGYGRLEGPRTLDPVENLTQVHHAGLQGRGSATFAQMGDKHFGRCFIAEAFARLRIQVVGELDELLLCDVG